MGAAVPVLREVRFRQTVAEQDNPVADAILGVEFDESGLHAHFEQA